MLQVKFVFVVIKLNFWQYNLWSSTKEPGKKEGWIRWARLCGSFVQEEEETQEKNL